MVKADMRRAFAIAVVLPAAAWVAYRLCYIPYRCNNEVGAATSVTGELWARSGEINATIMARHLLAQMEDCLRSQPDVGAYMVAAADLRILRRPEDALRLYRQALKIDRRPEIYLQIGNTLREMGNRTEAIRYYMLAVTFDPQYIYDRSVLPPELWQEVYSGFVLDERQFRSGIAAHPSAGIE